MIEIWKMDPLTAGAALRGRGFSAQEATCLVALKRRCALRDSDGPTAVEKRLLFARWLLQNARLSEGEPVSWDGGQRYPAQGRKRSTSRRILRAWWLTTAATCWPPSMLCELGAASLYWSPLPFQL